MYHCLHVGLHVDTDDYIFSSGNILDAVLFDFAFSEPVCFNTNMCHSFQCLEQKGKGVVYYILLTLSDHPINHLCTS